MWASFRGNLTVVEYLVSKGADVKAKSKEGRNVLDFAKDNSHLDCVKFFKEHITQLKKKRLANEGSFLSKMFSGR